MLEKTLESLLDCKEIKPVNPKEINPEYSLEGLILKLKLQYFGILSINLLASEMSAVVQRLILISLILE